MPLVTSSQHREHCLIEAMDRCGGFLFSFLEGLCGDVGLAEDLLQKLWVHVFDKFEEEHFCHLGFLKRKAYQLSQELMRHSDPRLTANLYTDVSHLPTFEVVQDLEWIETKPKDIGKPARLTRPQNTDFSGHFLSHIDISNESYPTASNPCKTKEKTATSCDNGGLINGRDYRIRTCDLLTPSEARYQTAPSPEHVGEDK